MPGSSNSVVPVVGGAIKEWRSLLLASLILILVLIVGYMCIQLYNAHSKNDDTCADTFKESYAPACSADWGSSRSRCQGLTTGTMPAVDIPNPSTEPCCGYMDVPPVP
jgi:hypothetical protein